MTKSLLSYILLWKPVSLYSMPDSGSPYNYESVKSDGFFMNDIITLSLFTHFFFVLFRSEGYIVSREGKLNVLRLYDEREMFALWGCRLRSSGSLSLSDTNRIACIYIGVNKEKRTKRERVIST